MPVGIGGSFIAVSVEKVVFGFIRGFPADQVDTLQVVICDGVVLDFRYHVTTIQKECGPCPISPLCLKYY